MKEPGLSCLCKLWVFPIGTLLQLRKHYVLNLGRFQCLWFIPREFQTSLSSSLICRYLLAGLVDRLFWGCWLRLTPLTPWQDWVTHHRALHDWDLVNRSKSPALSTSTAWSAGKTAPAAQAWALLVCESGRLSRQHWDLWSDNRAGQRGAVIWCAHTSLSLQTGCLARKLTS